MGRNLNLPIILYYLVLLAIALLWTNRDLVEPSAILRHTYTLAFVIPLFFYRSLAPSAIILFTTIRLFSVAPYGYLPSDTRIYMYFVVSIIIVSQLSEYLPTRRNNLLIVLLVFSLFSNLMNNLSERSDYEFQRMVLIIIMLSSLVKNTTDKSLLEFSFILVTFILSIYGLIFYDDLVDNMMYQNELLRVYWFDPNYLGSVLAIGMVIAFYKVLFSHEITTIFKVFLILTVILGFINLAYFASRGAFLTTIIPFFFILYRKTKTIKSLLLAFLLIGAAIILFQNLNIFQPLVQRLIEGDTIATGSSRTTIWKESFELFAKSDILTLIFGGGSDFSSEIAGRSFNRNYFSVHNNFLMMLFDYGLTGLLVFLSLLYIWIKKNTENTLAISLILILVFCSLTLTPLIYLPFWFLILLIDKQELTEKNDG